MTILGLEDEFSRALLAAEGEYQEFLEANKEYLGTREKAFNEYMNKLRAERALTWKQVAERIGFTPRTLYKILSFETPIRQRDKIIRIGYGMELSLEEIQKALQLYGFSRLYVRDRRDVLLMKLFMDGVYEIDKVDAFLKENGEKELQIKREKRESRDGPERRNDSFLL